MARQIVSLDKLAEAQEAADAAVEAATLAAEAMPRGWITVLLWMVGLLLALTLGELWLVWGVVMAGQLADLPARIGPAEFSTLGALVAVRCPSDLDPLMQRAGGLWEPGSRRWLIEHRRMGPLMRALWRTTDPLFRRVGMDLDGEGN